MPLAAVNAALQGLTHTPDLNYFGGADLTIATSDGIASANRSLALIETYRRRDLSPWPFLAEVIARRRKGLLVPSPLTRAA
jgi:hypothetical protein